MMQDVTNKTRKQKSSRLAWIQAAKAPDYDSDSASPATWRFGELPCFRSRQRRPQGPPSSGDANVPAQGSADHSHPEVEQSLVMFGCHFDSFFEGKVVGNSSNLPTFASFHSCHCTWFKRIQINQSFWSERTASWGCSSRSSVTWHCSQWTPGQVQYEPAEDRPNEFKWHQAEDLHVEIRKNITT